MPVYGFSVERRDTPFDPTLVLSGELEIVVVGAADCVLSDEIAAVDGDVGVDLSGLDFIGFAGVDLLVTLSRRMASQRRRLTVTATNPTIDRILNLTGVTLKSIRTGALLVPNTTPARGARH